MHTLTRSLNGFPVLTLSDGPGRSIYKTKTLPESFGTITMTETDTGTRGRENYPWTRTKTRRWSFVERRHLWNF